MDRGGTLQELSRSTTIPRTQEAIPTTMEAITMEDTHTMKKVCTTIMAPGMALGMEEAATITVPTLQHQPRGI